MRTLVIGIPLPHVSFDNYSFLSAPSFADYPRMIVEMEAVSRVVDEVIEAGGDHLNFAGQAVVNGPGSSKAFSLAELLAMRRREAEWFLARSGVLVCFVHPDAAHTGIQGLDGWRRYAWLPAPEGFRYESGLRPGFGKPGVEILEGGHPFAPYIETFGPRLAYRALANEDAPGFRESGRVFARSAGGVAVGFQIKVSEGTIVFLPPLPRFESDRPELAETLFQCFERWQGEPETLTPEWIRKEVS